MPVVYNIPTDKELVEKAIVEMKADLSRIYSMAELATRVGTRPYSLKRIFKNQTGESLAGYYRRIRIEKARELLETTNNTLQMIAEAVGYSEGNNFLATFKSVTGLTPGEWRRRAWAEMK